MLIALLPVVLVIFLVLIILAICAALFGSKESLYKSSFVLPFDTTNFSITSPYGERIDPISNEQKFHSGIDVVPTSLNLVAVADGIVITSAYDPDSAGEHVIIEHKISGTTYRSGYYHLQENSRVVKSGEQVKQGQQIGLMGSTGYSTGTHLHFVLQEYNAKEKKFDYTDPTSIIKNKILAKSFNLYDYTNNRFNTPFDNKNLYDNVPNYSLN